MLSICGCGAKKRGEQDENETVTLYKYPAVFCLPLFCLSELTKILSQASVYLVYVLHET